MSLGKLGFVATTAVFLATSVFAANVTYLCNLKVPYANGWVPEQIVIVHNTANGEVVVNDPIIHHYFGAPVKGKVQTDNDKRITFRWDLKGIRNSLGQYAPTFVYRASILKASKKVWVTAEPIAYSDNFSAGGTCSIN